MIVIAPRSQAIERRHRLPDQVPVTQPGALLTTNLHAKLSSRSLPRLEQLVRPVVAHQGPCFLQNLHAHLTAVTIRWAANIPWARQFQQICFGARVCFQAEGPEFSLR